MPIESALTEKGVAMEKATEIVNAPYMVDAVEDAIAFDRRRFFGEAGVAALALQFLPLVAHASGHSPIHGNEAADNLIIHTGPGLMSHVHDLLIPYAVLKAPPLQGVELTTTQALLHRHTVALTQEQLRIVNGGGTVTKKASSHLIVIALANRRD
jgi:hypothetical protein